MPKRERKATMSGLGWNVEPKQNKTGPHWVDGRRVIFLYVPYAEREDVKARGARWSPTKRMWWILAEVDREPFLRWLPPTERPGASLETWDLMQQMREAIHEEH